MGWCVEMFIYLLAVTDLTMWTVLIFQQVYLPLQNNTNSVTDVTKYRSLTSHNTVFIWLVAVVFGNLKRTPLDNKLFVTWHCKHSCIHTSKHLNHYPKYWQLYWSICILVWSPKNDFTHDWVWETHAHSRLAIFFIRKKNQPKEPPLDKCNRHYTDVCNAIHETVKHYHMYTYDITRQITTTSTYNIYHTPV